MAIKDMFGYKRNPKPKSVFSVEESVLTFGSGGGLGFLVQNWDVNYAQDVQEIFELGSSALYWLKSRPTGQGRISRIIGDSSSGKPGKWLPAGAYDLCDGGVFMMITAASGMCDNTGKRVQIQLDGVAVTGVGFQMQVQNSFLMENMGFRFAAMDVM